MSLVSRAAAPVAAALLALCTACGGSLADTDLAPRTTPPPPPMSPFCAALQANSSSIQQLSLLTGSGVVPPGELAATVEAIRRSGNDLTANAPDALRADVQQTVDTINLQLDVLVKAGGDRAALANDPRVREAVNSPEVNAARQRVGQYASRTCPPGSA
jgi:hypothetical protein